MNRRSIELRGFTLVEASMCVVLVGVLLVAATGSFGALARLRRQQMESRRAMLLAQQLISEIQSCPFVDPGGTPALRSAFNGVDDYAGYSASPPVSRSGIALGGYAQWAEDVAVACVRPADGVTVVGSSTLKRITVTITAPSGKSYALSGLRSTFGPYEANPATSTIYITAAAIQLQGAKTDFPVFAGAHPLNISFSQ